MQRVGASGFPYPESEKALQAIAGRLADAAESVKAAKSLTEETVCASANRDLWRFHEAIGCVLRSTDDGIAFESYPSLLRMVRQVVGKSRALVMVSGWEYSPLVYPSTLLDGFVFISMPAAEAGNPLLLPLAGHELGHPCWGGSDWSKRAAGLIVQEYGRMRSEPGSTLVQEADPQRAREFAEEMMDLCLFQLEEIFCDALGVALFAESFPCAFAYLLSFRSGQRAKTYPATWLRAEMIRVACRRCGAVVPDLFEAEYSKCTPPASIQGPLRDASATADLIAARLAEQVVDWAVEHAARSTDTRPNKQAVDNIASAFDVGVPASGAHQLVDIISAAWRFSSTRVDAGWMPSLTREERRLLLHDLTLKTIETSEIMRQAGGA